MAEQKGRHRSQGRTQQRASYTPRHGQGNAARIARHNSRRTS